LRLDFSLSRITSATSDVLANFSRLSIFISLVKSFFAAFSSFLLVAEFFTQQKPGRKKLEI